MEKNDTLAPELKTAADAPELGAEVVSAVPAEAVETADVQADGNAPAVPSDAEGASEEAPESSAGGDAGDSAEAAPEDAEASDDEQAGFNEFRPEDVSEDGSPHGPLDLFSDGEQEEEQAPANVPTFAAFHAPEDPAKAGQPLEEEEDEDDEEDEFEDDGEERMSLLGHLGELRRRLTRIIIAIIIGFFAFYGVAEPLYGYLSAPLKACMPEGSKLIYTSPAGAFFTYMKVALVASMFGTSPFSFYQIWAFIAPGLYKEEKQAIIPLAFFSSLFFIAGASFCFFLVFPIAFQFFMGFATDAIVPMISVEEYLSFALKLLIAFGLVFEMPLFAYFLSRFGLLKPDFMRRQRRYAILLIFIMAAILTPPDVFSQCLMAMPMLLLYEVSIYVSKAAYRERKKPAEKAEETEESA